MCVCIYFPPPVESPSCWIEQIYLGLCKKNIHTLIFFQKSLIFWWGFHVFHYLVLLAGLIVNCSQSLAYSKVDMNLQNNLLAKAWLRSINSISKIMEKWKEMKYYIWIITYRSYFYRSICVKLTDVFLTALACDGIITDCIL